MSIGKIIASLRKSENLTQADLASTLNLDKSTVAKYETDKCEPSIDVLIALAKHFDVSADYLLGLE